MERVGNTRAGAHRYERPNERSVVRRDRFRRQVPTLECRERASSD